MPAGARSGKGLQPNQKAALHSRRETQCQGALALPVSLDYNAPAANFPTTDNESLMNV
jgi:hypothetical protein